MSQRLTPVDILNLRFRRKIRGYAPAEVDELLRRVAADLEHALAEGATLRERLTVMERELTQYRTMEATLRDALVLAQKAADQTRAAAHAQAEARLQEAQTRAGQQEAQTQARVAELNLQLDRLRQERRRLAHDLRARLNAHLTWLNEELEAESEAVQTVSPLITAPPTLVLSLPEETPLAVSASPQEWPTHTAAPVLPSAPAAEDVTVKSVFPPASQSANAITETPDASAQTGFITLPSNAAPRSSEGV